MMDLSIVVVSWNTRDLLCRCLESIAQTASGMAYEIVVVDNGSTDGSVRAVCEAFPLAQVIANAQNQGFARANNQAIRLCRGRYVLLLNSDTVVRPGALALLVRFLDQHADVGIVGPELLNGDGSLQRSWAKFPTFLSEIWGKNFRARRRYTAQDAPEAYSVDWVGGACFLIRRETIAQVGLLDEQFFMYSEETDWCFRARRRGWEICYYPAAQVVHFGGQSSRQASTRTKIDLYRSKLLFFEKHYGRKRARLLGQLYQALFLVKATGERIMRKIGLLAPAPEASRAHELFVLRHAIAEYFREP